MTPVKEIQEQLRYAVFATRDCVVHIDGHAIVVRVSQDGNIEWTSGIDAYVEHLIDQIRSRDVCVSNPDLMLAYLGRLHELKAKMSFGTCEIGKDVLGLSDMAYLYCDHDRQDMRAFFDEIRKVS